jgi:hypothetical protein
LFLFRSRGHSSRRSMPTLDPGGADRNHSSQA